MSLWRGSCWKLRGRKELAESEVTEGSRNRFFAPLSLRPILDYRACSQTKSKSLSCHAYVNFFWLDYTSNNWDEKEKPLFEKENNMFSGKIKNDFRLIHEKKKKKTSLSIVLTTRAFLPCRPLKTVVKQEKMG